MLDGVGCLIEPHRNSESMMFDSQWRWRKECCWIYNNLCGCSFMFTLQSSTFILDSYKISPDLLNFQQTSSNTNESTCSWRTCQRHWSCHALSKLAVANHVWAKKNWPNGPSKPLQCVEPEQRRKGKLPMKPFKGTYSYSYLFFWGGGDGFQAENPDIFLVKIQKIICKAARQFSGTGKDFTKNKHCWFAVSRCVPLAKVEGCWKRRWTKVGNRIISSFQPFPAVKTIGGSTLQP